MKVRVRILVVHFDGHPARSDYRNSLKIYLFVRVVANIRDEYESLQILSVWNENRLGTCLRKNAYRDNTTGDE